MAGLVSVGYFLFSTLFSVLIFILWLRFAIRYFRISALHPASQMIIGATNPILSPFNRLFSTFKITATRYDWPCFCMITFLELLKFTLIGPLFLHAFLSPLLIIFLTLGALIIEPCNLLFYAIIIRVILSWISPGFQHPIALLIFAMTEPMLILIRRRLPLMAGLDFSPLVAIIILKIITLFIAASLPFHLL